MPAEVLRQEAEKYIDKERLHVKSIEEAILEAKEKYKQRAIFIIGSFYVYKSVIDTLKE